MIDYFIQNILVPLDLSESSLNALDTAVALSKMHNASVYLLSVNETFAKLAEKQNKVSHLYQSNTDVLHALASSVKHKSDISPIVLEKEGNVVDVIYFVCEQYQIDLVIMGTHGASGYRDCFIGTNTYNTIKYAGCPILTVPAKRKVNLFKKILFPIRPAAGALTPYSSVLKLFNKNATVDVLGLSYHQMDADKNILNKIVAEIDEHLKDANATAQTFWGTSTDISESVIEHALIQRPDIVVLTSNLDVVTKPGFVGPHMQKLLHALRVPVLSIKSISVAHHHNAGQIAN